MDCISRLPDELKCEIAKHLPVSSLSKLSRVSRVFYHVMTPLLYLKDNRTAQPRAMFWAVATNVARVGQKVIMRVLGLAIKYGGDVNKIYHDQALWYYYTPLHMAAALGKVEVAKKLLDHRAKPNAWSKAFLDDIRNFDRRTLEFTMTTKVGADDFCRTMWRPLFLPFAMHNTEMIKLLLSYGASPVLAITDPYDAQYPELSTINILHIIAACPERGYKDAANESYFKKYSDLINEAVLDGKTPLFTALHHGHYDMLVDIIANGGDIEEVSGFGRTPLIQAITYYYMGMSPDVRKKYREYIGYLVKVCHANVGKHPDVRVAQTPLTAAITAMPTDYNPTTREVRPIIDLLLEHGADINEATNHGFTILHVLGRAICQRKLTGALLDVFESLVERGADLSMPLPDGRSILGACIVDYHCEPSKFYRLLLKSGASIVPQEVNSVFKRWAAVPKIRRALDFDIFEYSKSVSQREINAAYLIAINRGDDKLFEVMQSHFPRTTIAEEIAIEALIVDENHTRRFNAALKFDDFNGDYMDENGASLLHAIIDRLKGPHRYKITQAINDARAVLLRGASLEQRDRQGKTPIDRLWEMRGEKEYLKYSSLRLYLYDVKMGLEHWEGKGKSTSVGQGEYEKMQMDIFGVVDS